MYFQDQLWCWGLQTECDGIIRILSGVTGPQSGSRGFVECIGISVRAVSLEEAVEFDSRGRASGGGIVTSCATIGGAAVGQASALAADREAGGIEGTYELSWADGSEINIARRNRAADVICNSDGQSIAVDKTNIVEILVTISLESELCDCNGRDPSSCMWIAKQASVTSSRLAGQRTGWIS